MRSTRTNIASGILLVMSWAGACAPSVASTESAPGHLERPAGAAVPSGDVAPSGDVWSGDAETGDLSQFRDTPWNTAFASAPTITSDPQFVRDGEFAIRSAIPADAPDGSAICCGARSELEPQIGTISDGEELFFGVSTLLSPDFPVDEAWQVITQWKQIDGSPPLSLNVENGEYQIQGGASHPDGSQHFIEPVGDAVPGTWVDWVLHVKFSADPSIGYVAVWQGDQLVLPEFHPPGGTMYPADQDIYLKTGYYRDESIQESGSVYYDNWRISRSLEAVIRVPTS